MPTAVGADPMAASFSKVETAGGRVYTPSNHHGDVDGSLPLFLRVSMFHLYPETSPKRCHP